MRASVRLVKGLRISFLERKVPGGSAILLIHGNSSCKEVFAGQFKALCGTSLSVVAPDLPGHGGSDDSPSPERTYSFPGYAEILRTLMVDLGYESFHVVGWSLGGHIGLELWAGSPAAKSLLISGTPPIELTPAGIQRGFRWTRSTALAGCRSMSDGQVKAYLEAMMGRSFPANHHLSRMARRTDGNARSWMLRNGLGGRGCDEVRAVRTIGRPLSIVQGRSDPFVDHDYLENLDYKNLFCGEPIFVDAGHAAHWEIPDVFNFEMLRFLDHGSLGGGVYDADGRGVHRRERTRRL